MDVSKVLGKVTHAASCSQEGCSSVLKLPKAFIKITAKIYRCVRRGRVTVARLWFLVAYGYFM